MTNLVYIYSITIGIPDKPITYIENKFVSTYRTPTEALFWINKSEALTEIIAKANSNAQTTDFTMVNFSGPIEEVHLAIGLGSL